MSHRNGVTLVQARRLAVYRQRNSDTVRKVQTSTTQIDCINKGNACTK